MPMHTSCFVSNYQNKLKRRRTRPSAIVTSLRDHGTRSGMRPIILREAVQKELALYFQTENLNIYLISPVDQWILDLNVQSDEYFQTRYSLCFHLSLPL
uniref:Uncharacterized protein n=1 Tax=Ascaris lumbricoides TaxID=6252 RepID=A0A0M3HM74_ASCLU